MSDCYPIAKLLIPRDISTALKIPKTLGEHILIKRLSDGLLQKDVIKQLKISETTLSHWENNKTKNIPVHKIPAIISFLNYCPVEQFSNEGEKLALYRKYQGLTQKQLAEKVGSDESYICRWETMEYKIPYDKVQCLQRLFKTEFTNVAPNYHQKMPNSIKTIGDHLRKVRLERGLSIREATRCFSLKSPSSYRAWETNRDIQISAKYYPEIVAFLNYCPIEAFSTFRRRNKSW